MHDRCVSRGPALAPIAPQPEQPALERACRIHGGLRDLVSRIRRIGGAIVSRPEAGNEVPAGDTIKPDLATSLRGADAELAEAHRLLGVIESDLGV